MDFLDVIELDADERHRLGCYWNACAMDTDGNRLYYMTEEGDDATQTVTRTLGTWEVQRLQ